MFGLKLSVRGHQHVFQLEIPELQAFHGKIELGPEIIIMALILMNGQTNNIRTYRYALQTNINVHQDLSKHRILDTRVTCTCLH